MVSTHKIRGVTKINSNKDSTIADDGRLIDSAHSDPAEFAKLYRRHYDDVFRYCVHRLFDRQTAEDITSAVFLKVVENLSRFKGSEKQFRNWLYKIATNAVNSHLRSSLRRKKLLNSARQKANIESVDCEGYKNDSDKKLALLREAVFALRPRYQTIITLRFFENMKITEIAEVLASSDGTIRSQLARALANLRKKIDAREHEVLQDDR